MATLLVLLGVVCLSLVAWHNQARTHEHQALQARWNARAGREHYLATGQLPDDLRLAPRDSAQRCRATREADGTLVFEGQSGKARCLLLCLKGDPARLAEEP